jgi:hypothetical protein
MAGWDGAEDKAGLSMLLMRFNWLANRLGGLGGIRHTVGGAAGATRLP